MSNLAPILRMLKQASADQIALTPGESVYAIVDGRRKELGGDRMAARTILAVAGEVLSQDELRDLPSQRPRIVRHEHDGDDYVIEVAREGQNVRLVIRPAQKPSAGLRPSIARSEPEPEPEPPQPPQPPRHALPREEPKKRKSQHMRSMSRPPGRTSRTPAAMPATPTNGGDVSIELDAVPRDRGMTEPARTDVAPACAATPAPAFAVTPTPASAFAPAPAPARLRSGPAAIDSLLREMLAKSASDLHLSTGNHPVLRVHGEIAFLSERPALRSTEVFDLLREIMTDKATHDFEEKKDADFAYELAGTARFRVNVFEDRNGVGAVLRQIPIKIVTASELGLPKACLDLCLLSKGLVVVTGPTGSGKSTTLAAMVDHINKTRSDHIITIEDPVEFVHPNAKCLVNQREVGLNTKSFKNALRAALREDPDIVLVGEMRDLETIAIAIETAETGHLVFGTLHTTTAVSTVDRIVDQFPPDRQAQIRVMLSDSLKGVIAQVLCKKVGGGRVAAHEILLGTSAVSALVRDGKTFQLPSVMQTSKGAGMVTMNDSLFSLVQKKLVDPREAYIKAVDKSGLLAMFKSAGLPTTFG